LRAEHHTCILPPQSSVHVIPVRKVPPVVNLGNHLPCTATAVTQDENATLQLDYEETKAESQRMASPLVRQIRFWTAHLPQESNRTVEECVDVDSARRAVASLVEKINGNNPRISLRAITISALCSHFERCELAQGNTWRGYSTKKCYAGYLKH
jgi:hypothetical protein